MNQYTRVEDRQRRGCNERYTEMGSARSGFLAVDRRMQHAFRPGRSGSASTTRTPSAQRPCVADLPGFSRLLIPALGEEGNGISVGDVDGDGNDEVVVVYEANIEDEKVQKAALLKREDEAWRVVWDTKGSATA